MDGKELGKLKLTAEHWWELVSSWIRLPLKLIHDVESSDIRIVDLIAYQRQINRFIGEPEWLYRLRVKHAFINAKEAGTPSGMRRIFKRLKLDSDVNFEERASGYDWDQIGIYLKMSALGKYQNLLDVLLEQYGRTCRRWLYHTSIDDHIGVAIIGISVVNEETIVYPDNTIPLIKISPKMVAANVINSCITVFPKVKKS